MKIKISKHLTESQTKQVDRLWNELYPIKLKDRFGLLLKDIKEYNHHLLLNESGEILGWAVAFLCDEETWFSILVSPENQNNNNQLNLLVHTTKNLSLLETR